MDKTQEHYEKDTKLNTDQPPLFILFFLDFVPQYFFVSSDSFICSTMGCVVENAALLNMVFLYVHVSSAGEGALILVVKVVQVVFPCVHVDSAGNVSEAKRCYLLFPLQQSLICMGLEEAISWRSVVHCCKGCLSCFPLCPRDFLSRQRENYMRVYGFSLGRTSGESYFCSRKRVITLKRKSGL